MHLVLSARTRTSKTVAPVDLIFVTQEDIYQWLSPPLRSSGLDSRIRILHHLEIGQNMPPKYVMTSNVRCGENNAL